MTRRLDVRLAAFQHRASKGIQGLDVTQVAPLLSAMEDSALAMAEDEYVHERLVRCVLSVYFERNVGFPEVRAILGRLSRLGLVRWRVRERGRVYFRIHPGASARRHKATSFTMSAKGIAYFALPRRVRE